MLYILHDVRSNIITSEKRKSIPPPQRFLDNRTEGIIRHVSPRPSANGIEHNRT